MSEAPLSEQIPELLRRAQTAGEPVPEFAHMHLAAQVTVLNAALAYQRMVGRLLAHMGEDTDHVRVETERWIVEAQVQLRDKLTRLLEWAHASGRMV